MILSGGPPAFANNSSVSGLAFFSTKHFVISERVLFHFGTKPEVSKFSREKRLDSSVGKEVVLVSVQFHGGFLLLWFFSFSKLFVMQKEICQHKKFVFQDNKYFNNPEENALMLLEHFPLLSSPSPLF